MEKPIIATNLDGFLIKHEAFTEPHKSWFQRAISLTGNNSLKDFIGKENYFEEIKQAMDEIMPNATEKRKMKQAREWYQNDVVNYIKENPDVYYNNVAGRLKRLKEKYALALITSISEENAREILNYFKLENLYDIVFAEKTYNIPDKKELFKRFIRKYKKPAIYLYGDGKDVSEKLHPFKLKTANIEWEKMNPKDLLILLQ